MEELHVSRSRNFQEENWLRLWGSNFILPGLECQDSLQLWRQRREAPRCWDWRRAHQEFGGFTTVLSGARSKCEPVAGLHSQRESFFNVHSQFLASMEKPVTGCHKKHKSNHELDNCQIRIIVGKAREQLLAEAKSEILRREYRADLAENNICDLKRHWFSSSGNWAYSNRVWTVQTRTSSTSRRIGRSRTSTSRYSYEKYSKVGRIEERSGISTQGIFDKKNGRTSFLKRCRICPQWAIISRSQATSVISSSSWTRRTAEPWLKLAVKSLVLAWHFRKRFWMVYMRVLPTTYSGMLNSTDFSIAGNIPVQSKYEETRNRKWLSRPQSILSQNGQNPKQLFNFQF